MPDELTSAARELVMDYGISDLVLELVSQYHRNEDVFSFRVMLTGTDIVHELQPL